MSSSHVFGQTAQNEVFDGLCREAAGEKYTITGQPQVDDFSALLRSE
jgi:hypothetical protein